MNDTLAQTNWASDNEPISVAEIERTAKRLGYVFPRAFLDIASKFNGGYPSKTTFDVGDRKGCVFDNLLRLPDQFLEMYVAITNRLPSDVIPFAVDAFGDAICFDYREGGPKGEPEIVFWDHEKEDAESIHKLAFSFEDFVNNKLYAFKRLYEN